jgi:hypothetical protein
VARVRSQARSYDICDGWSDTGTGFSSNTSFFPCQHHSTDSRLHLNTTLIRRTSGQCLGTLRAINFCPPPPPQTPLPLLFSNLFWLQRFPWQDSALAVPVISNTPVGISEELGLRRVIRFCTCNQWRRLLPQQQDSTLGAVSWQTSGNVPTRRTSPLWQGCR